MLWAGAPERGDAAVLYFCATSVGESGGLGFCGLCGGELPGGHDGERGDLNDGESGDFCGESNGEICLVRSCRELPGESGGFLCCGDL